MRSATHSGGSLLSLAKRKPHPLPKFKKAKPHEIARMVARHKALVERLRKLVGPNDPPFDAVKVMRELRTKD